MEIERFPGKVKVIIHTAKPGILIGRKGENVKKIRQRLEAKVGKKIDLEIKEIKPLIWMRTWWLTILRNSSNAGLAISEL